MGHGHPAVVEPVSEEKPTDTMAVPGGTGRGDGGVTVDRDDVPFNTCDDPAADWHLRALWYTRPDMPWGLGMAQACAGLDRRCRIITRRSTNRVMSYESRVALRTSGVSDEHVLPNDPGLLAASLWTCLAVYALYQQASSGSMRPGSVETCALLRRFGSYWSPAAMPTDQSAGCGCHLLCVRVDGPTVDRPMKTDVTRG